MDDNIVFNRTLIVETGPIVEVKINEVTIRIKLRHWQKLTFTALREGNYYNL